MRLALCLGLAVLPLVFTRDLRPLCCGLAALPFFTWLLHWEGWAVLPLVFALASMAVLHRSLIFGQKVARRIMRNNLLATPLVNPYCEPWTLDLEPSELTCLHLTPFNASKSPFTAAFPGFET